MSITDKILELRTHREAIREAINGKGVDLPEGSHMNTYASAIDEISGGGEGGSDLPKFHGNPSLALNTITDYYGGDDKVTFKSIADRKLFQDGGTYLGMGDYFTVPGYPTNANNGVTLELTFKMDTNLDLYNSNQIYPVNTNTGYGILFHKNVWIAPIINDYTRETQLALGGSNQYQYNTKYSTYVHDLNKITTIHLAIKNNYAYLYIDGEYKGSARQATSIGINNPSVVNARNEAGQYSPAMTVYDFKVYDYRLEVENIQANYQNIQDKLQHIKGEN